MNNGKNKHKKRRRKIIFFLAFLTSIFLIVATYAWLSTTLNVKIRFVKMGVASNSGLFISLDGLDFSEEVVVSMDSIITDLKATYPNHTNQWAAMGLWPVSSNGIINTNSDKFNFYAGSLLRTTARYPNGKVKRLLNTEALLENDVNSRSYFIGFDIFLKNATGSPKNDNLYFGKTTEVVYDEEVVDDVKHDQLMTGLLNSLRIGLVKIGDYVPHTASATMAQSLMCDNRCQMVIYEPYSTVHTEASIRSAETYGITLVDGEYTPTYGIIGEGIHLEHTNGHAGTGYLLDTSYFSLQNTIKDDHVQNEIPIFELPNGITKYRVYIWLEGQDMDSLETFSRGASLAVNIDFFKDTAGYE